MFEFTFHAPHATREASTGDAVVMEATEREPVATAMEAVERNAVAADDTYILRPHTVLEVQAPVGGVHCAAAM